MSFLDGVRAALDRVVDEASPADIVRVAGSLHLAAEVETGRQDKWLGAAAAPNGRGRLTPAVDTHGF